MSDRPYTRRTRGSVRFDPYFTLEWFDETLGVWRPHRGRYDTLPQAQDASVSLTPAEAMPRAWRIMQVTVHGRSPLETNRE